MILLKKYNIQTINEIKESNDNKLQLYIDEILFRGGITNISSDLKLRISKFFDNFHREKIKKLIQTHKYIIYILFEYF